MKSFIKKLISWATATATVATMSFNIAAFADEKYPSIGNGFTAYTISTSRTYTFASEALDGNAIGWVDGRDEFKITQLAQNKRTGRVSARITYSTSKGPKTAWVDYSAISAAIAIQ